MAASASSKISFPLKWKIIGTNASLLLLTVFLFVAFASNLFNEDKTATIYETTLESSLTLAERFNVYLRTNEGTFNLLKGLSTQVSNKDGSEAQLFKSVFAENEHAVAFASWSLKGKEGKEKGNNLEVYLENDLFLKTHEIDQNNLFKVLDTRKQGLQNVEKAVWFPKLLKVPLWLISFKDNSNHYMALFSMDEPLKEVSESSQFQSFMAIDGELLSTQKSNKGQLLEGLKTLIDGISDERAQVVSFGYNGQSYLAGVAPVGTNIFAVSLINDSIIYQASRFLREQSFYFSLFIFSLTIFMGVLISRRMTSDLSKLHDASIAFSLGDFNKDFTVKSKDEIGSLAVTFKKMGQDILRYIDEMKDKARLENEMEVARLVQESFIPQEEMAFNLIKLSSFYRPTSECSGDWWGSFKCANKLILVVADATGHGVPAALLTATASGCLHQLEYDVEKGRRSDLKACEVLEVFNYAIHKMGGKVHMTAFALVIDSNTGEVTYSNASHNPPLLIKNALSEERPALEKDSLIPLMEAQGQRLGQDSDSQYTDASFQLEKDDLLYLYSDGLVEQVNSEEKQWGNRRFYKEILNHLNNHKGIVGLTGLSRHLLSELTNFSGRTQWDDDITLLSVGLFEGDFTEGDSSRYRFDEKSDSFTCGENNDVIYGDYLEQFPFKVMARDNNQLGELINLKEALKSDTNVELQVSDLAGAVVSELTFNIHSTTELEGEIEKALEKFDYTGYFDSPKNPFSLLVRELASNAIYHQNEKTSSQERTGEFRTDANASIEVRLTQAESGLGVRVTDRSGRLTYSEFRRALIRAFQEQAPENKEGGAGLGLYMVFQNSNKVLIDIVKNQRTQVLAVIEKEKRYKNFRSKNTQLLFNER